MRVNNQLWPLPRDWSAFEFRELPSGSGVLFDEITLDERIGPEAAALLIGSEQDELAAKPGLDFRLKAGIAATQRGPILFLIWWVPPIIKGRPALFYEQIMNPLNAKISEVLRRVAEQTHLHLIVTSEDGQILNVFEFQNTFGFDRILARVDSARKEWHGAGDFPLAKRIYQHEYQIEDIVAGRYD